MTSVPIIFFYHGLHLFQEQSESLWSWLGSDIVIVSGFTCQCFQKYEMVGVNVGEGDHTILKRVLMITAQKLAILVILVSLQRVIEGW